MQRSTVLQSIVRRTCVVLVATAGAAPWAVVAAQSIKVNLGGAPIVAAAPGTKLAVPIIIDLSAAGGAASIASLQAGLTWNVARLSFDSLRRAPGATGWTVTSNTGGAATGSIAFSAVRGTNLPATTTVANAFFTVVGSTGGTHLLLTPTAAANASSQNMLAAVRPRALDVCVSIPGQWGDVTSDGIVDISDAQQIARFAAALSVVDSAATAQRGDVNASGTVDVVDAEEIARYSVGLPAVARIGTDVSTIPAATSIVVAPAGPVSLTVGQAQQLLATSAAGATDLTGCAPTQWSSSNPGVAVVNEGGFVSTLGAGTASITASTSGVTSSVSLDAKVLLIASKLALGVQPSSSAGSGVPFARQPAVQLQTSTSVPVPLAGVSVTAAIASGGGTLGGSTTVLTDVNGLATFANLSITGTAGVRTVVFSSLGLTSITSAAVSIVAGPASQLSIVTQPSATAVSGAPFTQQPSIQLRDLSGNSVAQSGVVVTASIATGSGTIGGTATATTNTSGRATFTNLAINGSGTFTLRYTSAPLANATSSSIAVTAPATQLSITTQPSPTAVGGVTFAQQPAIQLRDATNGAVSQSGVTITAAIASGPGTLGGTLTATTNSSGLATFTNLYIHGPGGDNTIRFTAPAPLTGVTSAVVAATTGTPPAIVDAEPVFDAASVMVHQDNMDLYSSLSAMLATIGSSIPGFHPGDDPRNELGLTTGRGLVGKALRISFQGGAQTGATWETHGAPSTSNNVTHVIQYYARVNFATALNTTIGVKWLMGWHNSYNDRIQWHMHWLNSTCGPPRPTGHNTYWQVMDQSRFTNCQGAQPAGPYIDNVNDNQWHRFTHEYRPNSKAGGRDGFARMWIDGVKITDVSLAACGVTPPGGQKPWCSLDDVDNLAINDGISFLKFGGAQTTDTPPWTMDIDDLRWWRR